MIFNGFFSKTTKICLNLPINLFSNLQLATGYSALWQRPAGPVQSPVFRSESSQPRQRPGRFFQPDRCAKFLWPWSWRGNHGAWICVFWLAKFNAYLRSARVAARCLTAIQRPDQVRGSSVQKRLWSRVLWRFQGVHGADQSDRRRLCRRCLDGPSGGVCAIPSVGNSIFCPSTALKSLITFSDFNRFILSRTFESNAVSAPSVPLPYKPSMTHW